MSYTKYVTVLICVFFLLFTLSCGRKSLPKPPEERAPSPVKSARIEARKSSAVIIWNAPTETASGKEIIELRSFDILRRTSKRGVSSSFVEIAVIPVIDNTNLTKDFAFEDKNIELGVVYDYIIVPRDAEGIEGEPDTILRLSFLGTNSLYESIPFTLEDPVQNSNKK